MTDEHMIALYTTTNSEYPAHLKVDTEFEDLMGQFLVCKMVFFSYAVVTIHGYYDVDQ